jgi:CRP/FNR family cyclic AMP-dependent transcriptional regulator
MRTAGQARLLCLHGRDLQRVAESHPEIWRLVAPLVATNEALAVAAVNYLMLREPRKRLAATLLRLSGLRLEFQDRRPLNRVPVTLQELSEAANLSRTVAAEIMFEFAEIGALKKEYGRIRSDRPEVLSGIV